MANYKLEYSQIVRRKLKSLRAYLKAEYDEEVSKKSILIPLCKACNRAKGSRLMTVEECCRYLGKDFIDELIKYSR